MNTSVLAKSMPHCFHRPLAHDGRQSQPAIMMMMMMMMMMIMTIFVFAKLLTD